MQCTRARELAITRRRRIKQVTSSEDIVRRNLEKPLHRHVHHHRPELPLAACSLSTSSASCASDLANPKAIATFSGERRTRLRVVPHQSQIAFSPPASCTCTPARTAWRHSRRDDPVPDTTTHTHTHEHQDTCTRTRAPGVVISRVFFSFSPCNHII